MTEPTKKQRGFPQVLLTAVLALFLTEALVKYVGGALLPFLTAYVASRLIRPAGGSEIFEHLMKVRKDDVFVAISFPRYTTGIVNATEFASKTGAKVIAITDSMSSPLVPHADVALIAKSEMVSFVDSLVAPMSIINAMIAYIGKKKHAEVTQTLGRLEQVWKEYNVYTSAAVTEDEE